MMRDFNDLQFFAAVVVHRGFSAAARARGLPKSRVSLRDALLEERLGLRRGIVVARSALLAKEGEPTSTGELGKFPILHQEQQGGNVWHLTADNGKTCTVAVEPRLTTGSFDILIAAACQGAGIALLPAANCQEALAAGTLARVLPELSGIDGILHLVFVSRRGMLPAVRAVIDFAATALKSSADQ